MILLNPPKPHVHCIIAGAAFRYKAAVERIRKLVPVHYSIPDHLHRDRVKVGVLLHDSRPVDKEKCKLLTKYSPDEKCNDEEKYSIQTEIWKGMEGDTREPEYTAAKTKEENAVRNLQTRKGQETDTLMGGIEPRDFYLNYWKDNELDRPKDWTQRAEKEFCMQRHGVERCRIKSFLCTPLLQLEPWTFFLELSSVRNCATSGNLTTLQHPTTGIFTEKQKECFSQCFQSDLGPSNHQE